MSSDSENLHHEKVYIRILQTEFKKRQTKNKRFSLRAFAHFLGLNHSTLSVVMSNQKGLSLAMAKKITDKLALPYHEREMFILSVTAHCSRSMQERLKAQKAMTRILSAGEIKALSPDSAEELNHWIFIAVFELICGNIATSVSDISKRLSIPEHRALKVITTLQNLEIITQSTSNCWQPTTGAIETFSGIPLNTIIQYHVSVCEKAITSIQEQSAEDREFQNTIFSINRDQVPKAKKMIQDFVKYFNSELQGGDAPKEIYSMSVNFFRITND
jgi:uncharacterized protein (TIGR02147 family)